MGTVEWIALTVVGFGIGIGLGFWLSKFLRGDDREKLADTEAEFTEYKEKVTEHFSQSAAHFQAIGQQYRELHAHMAAGSEKLCEIAETDEQLQFPRPDEVIIAKSAVGLAGISEVQNAGDPVAVNEGDDGVRSTEAAEPDEPTASNEAATEAGSEQSAEASGDDASTEDIGTASAKETEEDVAADEGNAESDSDLSRQEVSAEQSAESLVLEDRPVDYVKDETDDSSSAKGSADTASDDSSDKKAAEASSGSDEEGSVESALAKPADEKKTRLYH